MSLEERYGTRDLIYSTWHRYYLDALDGWQRDTLTWGAANQATLQLITTIRRAERDGRKTLRVADLAALINQHEEVQ